MIERANGEIIEKILDNKDKFYNCCLLFATQADLDKYNGVGYTDSTLKKQRINTFLNCILKQQFP